MITLDRIVGVVLLLWICLYTASFGVWTWKKKNRLGAAAVFVIAILVLAIPAYVVFFINR